MAPHLIASTHISLVTGYLIPSSDSVELVERARELRANPNAAHAMVMNERRLIDTRHTVGRLTAGTLDAYGATPRFRARTLG